VPQGKPRRRDIVLKLDQKGIMRQPIRLPLSLFGILTLFFWPAYAGAAAKADEQSLRKIESELQDSRKTKNKLTKQAEKVRRDRNVIRAKLIRTAKQIQVREDRLITSEKRLRKLSASEKSYVQKLHSERTGLSHILGTISRLQRTQTPMLIVGPGTPMENLRASILLASIAPEMERRAEAIRGEIENLHQLRRQIADERHDIDRARQEMEVEKRKLAGLLRRKSSRQANLSAQARHEESRIATLSKSAKDIRDLVDRLHVDRNAQAGRDGVERRLSRLRQPENAALMQPIPSTKPKSPIATPKVASPDNQAKVFASLRGQLPLPARGRIIKTFGESQGYGPAAKGISIQTRPGAQVIVPFDGEVSYAGEFRGYGQLLIIAHGQGYHTLLAGLSRIDVVVGQLLLANEPVGEMGKSGRINPKLYVELRHRGEAINPLPWLALNNGRVKG
jgi:septal ring factor EnvC (AmiA/AmiB activator)